MNISAQTVAMLEKLYIINFYDGYSCESTTSEKANELHLGFDLSTDRYIGKSIKATKKETTFEYIMDKINTDNVYKSFSDKFNELLKAKNIKAGLNCYPATYGIGVFNLFNAEKSETKQTIETLLNSTGVKFENEYSEAGWVYRYKISKSAENIKRIETFLNQ